MRTLIALAGAALATGTASAAFLGVEIREDKGLPQSAIDAGIPADTRIFNFYAKFTSDDLGDNVTNVGSVAIGIQQADINGNPINQGAQIFNLNSFPNSDIGAPIDPGLTGSPTSGFETFVSIGLKADPTGGSDGTTADGDGVNIGATTLTGGWFVTGLPAQGVPVFNAEKDDYEVFFAQIAVSGLDVGASVNAPTTGENEGFTLLGDVFAGTLEVFPQSEGVNPGTNQTEIVLAPVPTPGAMALFGVAGLAAARRRR